MRKKILIVIILLFLIPEILLFLGNGFLVNASPTLLKILLNAIPAMGLLQIIGVIYLIATSASTKKKQIIETSLSPENEKYISNRNGSSGKASVRLGLIGIVLAVTPLFFYGFLFGLGAIIFGISQFVVDKSVYKNKDANPIAGILLGVVVVCLSIIIWRSWNG